MIVKPNDRDENDEASWRKSKEFTCMHVRGTPVCFAQGVLGIVRQNHPWCEFNQSAIVMEKEVQAQLQKGPDGRNKRLQYWLESAEKMFYSKQTLLSRPTKKADELPFRSRVHFFVQSDLEENG